MIRKEVDTEWIQNGRKKYRRRGLGIKKEGGEACENEKGNRVKG